MPKINGLSTFDGALLELDEATLETGAWLELLCATWLDELGVITTELLVSPVDDVLEPPSQADSKLANAVAHNAAEGLLTKRISEYLLFFLKVAPRYPQ